MGYRVSCFCGTVYDAEPDKADVCPLCRTSTNARHPFALKPWQTLEDELEDLMASDV